jgi:hypothetical protein
VGPTTFHPKKFACYKNSEWALNVAGFPNNIQQKINKYLEKLTSTKYPEQNINKFNQPCNRSWRPIGL